LPQPRAGTWVSVGPTLSLNRWCKHAKGTASGIIYRSLEWASID